MGAAGEPTDGNPRPSDHVFDRGLQHERTALAWDRTGLGFLVAAVLTLRSGGPPFDDLRHAPGYVAMVVGGVLLWTAGRRYRRREIDLREGRSMVQPGLVIVTGVTALLLSLTALLLVLAS